MHFVNAIIRRAMSSLPSSTASANPFLRARRNLIGLCQLTSHGDMVENYEKAASMVRRARADHPNCRMVFLPECFDFIAPTRDETLANASQEDGECISKYRELAKETGMWLSLGGFHHRVGDGKVRLPFNTHLLLNDNGLLVVVE